MENICYNVIRAVQVDKVNNEKLKRCVQQQRTGQKRVTKKDMYCSNVAWQRWKSQRIKIHRIAYRFFYRFLNTYPSLWIFCGNHKDLPKVSRLLVRGFFSWDFKIHRLVWIFLWIFGCCTELAQWINYSLPPPPRSVNEK